MLDILRQERRIKFHNACLKCFFYHKKNINKCALDMEPKYCYYAKVQEITESIPEDSVLKLKFENIKELYYCKSSLTSKGLRVSESIDIYEVNLEECNDVDDFYVWED